MTTVVEWLNGVMTGSLKMKPEIANAVDGLAAGILILMVSIGNFRGQASQTSH